ncbi:MAG: hypothetical protein A2017_03185 [Lentisphaerae bacterium GWF2_44_16]|nr:MAG: hypothetical protein A2017_03185 [Lentisphaerae bacterium GWF2_44_16]
MNKIKKAFNMVEITLAIAVIGIGVAGVMSLFPVALNASRDAVGNNYAPDIANQFLNYVSMQCNNDWNTNISTTAGGGIITETVPTNDDGATSWSATAISSIYTCPTSGLYKITQGSASATDFMAAVKVWKTQVTGIYVYGTSYNLTYQYGAQLHVEVSWPIEKPYAQREKRYYSLEIFNPSP